MTSLKHGLSYPMNEININGETYLLDFERAKNLGLISPKREPIYSIKEGDLFSTPNVSVIVVRSGYRSSKWNIMRGDSGGFHYYSDFDASGISENDLIAWLNNRHYKFVTNLNTALEGMVESFLIDAE